MPVEAILSRELEIRFIDARLIANEAKVNLGIVGYPSDSQEEQLIDESIRIYKQRPDKVKSAMRRLKTTLDDFKVPHGSQHSNSSDGEYSDVSFNELSIDKQEKPKSYKKHRLFKIRRR